MKAGRELDALVAEKVMGEPKPTDFPASWTVTFNNSLNGTPSLSAMENWMCVHRYENDDKQEWVPLPYSIDIASAWQVIDKIQEGNNWEFTIQADSGEWEIRCNAHISRPDYNERQHNARAMTAPLAICLAALKVVGYEEEI